MRVVVKTGDIDELTGAAPQRCAKAGRGAESRTPRTVEFGWT